MKKLQTIKLKGKDYVQVKDRILYFNENFPNGSISTEYTTLGNQVVFTAFVTPDVDKPNRVFKAHSHDQVTGDKALEKLETVAVGRALAFMGVGIIESIASADEIQKFNQRVDRETGEIITKPTKPSMGIELPDGTTLVKGVKNSKPWFGHRQTDGTMRWLKEEEYYSLVPAPVLDQPNF